MDQKVDKSGGSFPCAVCNKFYSSYKSLWNHTKKFHNFSVIPRNTNVILLPNQRNTNVILYENEYTSQYENEYTNQHHNCKYCDKSFTMRQYKWKHEQNCKNKMNLLEQVKILEEENNKLKTIQIIPLNINNGIINNNNGVINNTLNNTNNIQNNFMINQIGTEKIDLNSKDIRCIARDGLNGAITCVKKTNFNRKKPENHSFYASSLEGQYCTTINQKTQKPEKISKKELISKVLESSFKIIEGISIQIEFNEDLRKEIPKKERKRLQYILDNKYKFYEKKNWKTFYNSINSMSYNYKNLIMSTWKLLKEPENNNISDSESEYSEPDIKEVTCFSDSDDDSDSDSTIISDSDSDSDDDSYSDSNSYK